MCDCKVSNRISPTTARAVRRAKLNGREYIVAGFTSLVPGVLAGSEGPMFYPPEEVAANPGMWNLAPLTLGHPVGSARDPEVLAACQLGYVFRDRVEGNRRVGEAWFDEELTRKLAPEVLGRLSRGEPIAVSTGVFTVAEAAQGVHEGKEYSAIARELRPDHLAVLPDGDGACSIGDGCGIGVSRRSANQVSKPKPKGRPKMKSKSQSQFVAASKPLPLYGPAGFDPDALAIIGNDDDASDDLLPLPVMFKNGDHSFDSSPGLGSQRRGSSRAVVDEVDASVSSPATRRDDRKEAEAAMVRENYRRLGLLNESEYWDDEDDERDLLPMPRMF